MHYRLTSSASVVVAEGECHVRVLDGALVVTPTLVQPVRIAPHDIVAVSEPEPYRIRLQLRDGALLDLGMLGVLRTQLLADLADARLHDRSGTLVVGLGEPERFRGAAQEADAELLLYDDALVAIPASGAPLVVPYSFVESVTTDASGYRITVGLTGEDALSLGRLAHRTSEFVDLLRRRVTDARGRTGALLGILLPQIGPAALLALGERLRDGLAASRVALDGLDPLIWPALVEASCLPERVHCVAVLEQLGDVSIGLHQLASVEKGAVRTGAAAAPGAASAAPQPDDHATPASPAAGPGGIGGLGGLLIGGALACGVNPASDLGGDTDTARTLMMMQTLAAGPLRTGRSQDGWGATPAPDVGGPGPRIEPGNLTPARSDLQGLSVSSAESGAMPTVLVFCLARSPSGRIVYEVLNQTAEPTAVFDAVMTLEAVNRALVMVDFRPGGIAMQAARAVGDGVEEPAPVVALGRALLGRVQHTETWEAEMRALV